MNGSAFDENLRPGCANIPQHSPADISIRFQELVRHVPTSRARNNWCRHGGESYIVPDFGTMPGSPPVEHVGTQYRYESVAY